MTPHQFAPNNLNYISCDRCFYLSHKYKIQYQSGFPTVFSTLDKYQKERYVNLTTRDLSSKLEEGSFYQVPSAVEKKKRKKENKPQYGELDLPGKVRSTTLFDNKNRPYFLEGKPDLVLKFKNQTYGVIDFKTTSEADKTSFYKNQLEAYAQIFENPGQMKTVKSPLLTPVTYLGLVQFTPNEITHHDENKYQQNFIINHYQLERNEKTTLDFKHYITKLIDIIELPKQPEFNEDCTICKDYKKTCLVSGG